QRRVQPGEVVVTRLDTGGLKQFGFQLVLSRSGGERHLVAGLGLLQPVGHLVLGNRLGFFVLTRRERGARGRHVLGERLFERFIRADALRLYLLVHPLEGFLGLVLAGRGGELGTRRQGELFLFLRLIRTGQPVGEGLGDRSGHSGRCLFLFLLFLLFLLFFLFILRTRGFIPPVEVVFFLGLGTAHVLQPVRQLDFLGFLGLRFGGGFRGSRGRRRGGCSGWLLAEPVGQRVFALLVRRALGLSLARRLAHQPVERLIRAGGGLRLGLRLVVAQPVGQIIIVVPG